MPRRHSTLKLFLLGLACAAFFVLFTAWTNSREPDTLDVAVLNKLVQDTKLVDGWRLQVAATGAPEDLADCCGPVNPITAEADCTDFTPRNPNSIGAAGAKNAAILSRLIRDMKQLHIFRIQKWRGMFLIYCHKQSLLGNTTLYIFTPKPDVRNPLSDSPGLISDSRPLTQLNSNWFVSSSPAEGQSHFARDKDVWN